MPVKESVSTQRVVTRRLRTTGIGEYLHLGACISICVQEHTFTHNQGSWLLEEPIPSLFCKDQ